jgi:hypothetical protein
VGKSRRGWGLEGLGEASIIFFVKKIGITGDYSFLCRGEIDLPFEGVDILMYNFKWNTDEY